MASATSESSLGARLALALAALLLASPLRGESLLVFAAASLTDALTEIGTDYRAASGETVEFHFAGSSELARQIGEGAPADLFVPADSAEVDELAEHGLVVAGTRRELLSNRLVVVVAAERGAEVTTVADLATPAVRVLALAEPSTVPAGIYAGAFLRRGGLWSQLADKIVPTANVRAALAAVESGDADAAIVYATDAAISRRVRVAVEIPAAETPRIVYAAAVPTSARDVEGARRFLAYLASPPASAVFRRYGFLPLAGAPP